MFSTFSGPIRAGTVQWGSSDNTGVAQLVQSAAIPAAPGATTVAILPAGAQILEIIFDTTTQFNAATTFTVGDGSTANKYVTTSAAVTNAGRVLGSATGVFSEWANIGTSDVSIVVTTSSSTASTGAGKVTILYAQKSSAGAEFPSTP